MPGAQGPEEPARLPPGATTCSTDTACSPGLQSAQVPSAAERTALSTWGAAAPGASGGRAGVGGGAGGSVSSGATTGAGGAGAAGFGAAGGIAGAG